MSLTEESFDHKSVFVRLFGLHGFEGVQGAYAKDLRVRHYVEQMEGKPYMRHEKTLEKEKEHWEGKKDETPKEEVTDHGWDIGHLY
jgi:hypothetical protein